MASSPSSSSPSSAPTSVGTPDHQRNRSPEFAERVMKFIGSLGLGAILMEPIVALGKRLAKWGMTGAVIMLLLGLVCWFLPIVIFTVLLVQRLVTGDNSIGSCFAGYTWLMYSWAWCFIANALVAFFFGALIDKAIDVLWVFNSSRNPVLLVRDPARSLGLVLGVLGFGLSVWGVFSGEAHFLGGSLTAAICSTYLLVGLVDKASDKWLPVQHMELHGKDGKSRDQRMELDDTKVIPPLKSREWTLTGVRVFTRLTIASWAAFAIAGITAVGGGVKAHDSNENNTDSNIVTHLQGAASGLVDVTQNVGTSLATRVENAAAGKGEGTAQALWCSTFAEEYEKRTGQKPSASLLEERGCR